MVLQRLGKLGNPLTWLAAVALVSALVGIWHADETESRRLQQNTARDEQCEIDEQAYLQEMEQALAQAGCPGWIALASEGKSAFDPPETIQQVAHTESVSNESSEDSIPRITYPKPIRVASLPHTRIAQRNAQPVAGSPDDSDDLLDGMPDLLNGPSDTPPVSTSLEDSAPEPEPPPAAVESPAIEESKPEPLPVVSDPLPAIEMPEATAPPADRTPLPTVTPPKKAPETLPKIELPRKSEQPALPEPQELQLPQEPQMPKAEATAPPRTMPKAQPQTPVVQPRQMKPEPVAPPKADPAPPKQQTQTNRTFAPPPTPAAPHSVSAQPKPKQYKSHCEFVADNCYPSAETCSKCHEKIYDEWRVSSHAYAAISPMFHKFEQKISELSQGTVGYFCYRCHNPVGTTLGISRTTPLWELPQVAREGVTCIACHRVNQRYGKVNGERRIEPGNIHAPVYGSIGGGGVAEVTARKSHFKVKTSPHESGPGLPIHNSGYYFDQLHKPEFCVSCHQVAVQPGIKLEVVWEQYRASPACKKGVSCQDCHMGRLPGVPSGYEYGAAAEVNGKTVNKHRKHANHVFYGPGYSIAHPGIFPHNPDANRWSMRDWLLFDYRSGWGTDEFEDRVADGEIRMSFPSPWGEADDRYDAREIIEDNLAKLSEKAVLRHQLMENGSHVDGPYFDSLQARGQDLKFHYIITNTNEGHNLPSGSLGAQPQLWANVALVGPRGNRIWESGYTDRWGDVADIHSEDVRNKRIPYDWQLFNLQTMFLITGAKGTDREFFLPVNVDFDQLPFLRPGAQPITTLNHPPFIRMEGRSLAPLGSREVPYKVPGHLLCEPGKYRLSFRMRSRAEPIYFMRFCDATKEMQRAMNEWMIDFHQSSVEFVIR